MNGFVTFAVTFASLRMIWYVHFRRYALQDFTTIVLHNGRGLCRSVALQGLTFATDAGSA